MAYQVQHERIIMDNPDYLEEIRRDIESMNREELIEALAWNDPNGIYTDEDSDDEGVDPLTIEEARQYARAVFFDPEHMDPEEQVRYAAQIKRYADERRSHRPNPCYPPENDPDYEGMRVRYDLQTIPNWTQVRMPDDVYQFAKEHQMLDDVRERLYAIYLDQGNRPVGFRLVGAGSLDGVIGEPREIFGPAMMLGVAAVILVHNHPSGRLIPSTNDKKTARNMKSAAKQLRMRMLDFMIVSREGAISFSDEGLL